MTIPLDQTGVVSSQKTFLLGFLVCLPEQLPVKCLRSLDSPKLFAQERFLHHATRHHLDRVNNWHRGSGSTGFHSSLQYRARQLPFQDRAGTIVDYHPFTIGRQQATAHRLLPVRPSSQNRLYFVKSQRRHYLVPAIVDVLFPHSEHDPLDFRHGLKDAQGVCQNG